MRKRMLLLLLLIIDTAMLSGCWNYREIDDISIVAGMAIDKGEENKFILTYELVDLHESGMDPRVRSKLLETAGDTMFDAIRNAIKYNAPKMYFGHMEIVIVSREVAEEGIGEILDFISRDAEPRGSIDLLVSKEKTAREILNSQTFLTEIRSYEINEMLSSQRALSKAPKVQVYQFINDLPCQGVSPFLPTICLVGNAGIKTSELCGTAVFREDKLLGFLDEEETKYFLFTANKIEGGLLVLKNIPKESANISLEIFRNKTKVKPEYWNGKVSMEIDIKTNVALAEQSVGGNFTNESVILKLSEDAEEQLKRNIEKVIDKVQKDFGVDIFGFGRIVYMDMPDLWKRIEADWNTIFKDLRVNINTTIEIQNSGLLRESINVGGK